MKKKDATEKQFANIEENLSKTEKFIEDNSRILFSIIGLIVFIFIASYAFKNFYQKPLNIKAQKQLFIAEQYFEKDSFFTALNGNSQFDGLVEIANKYSNTKSGKLAKYYAGISYLHNGEYENAIKMLDKYNSKDKLLLSIAKSAIGDAFLELNQPKEALTYYQKALKINDNVLTSPILLMKCANIYETESEYNKALNCYQTIKTQYPDAEIAKTIDKYINSVKYSN